MNALLARLWRLGKPVQWRFLWLMHAKFICGITGVIRDEDGRVLLLRHRLWPEHRQWGFPTGYANKWRWVARFITVLHAAAKEGGIRADSIGSLAEWKQKHEAVWLATTARARLARAVGAEALTPETAGHARGRTGAPRRSVGLVLNETDARHDPALRALLRAVGRDWWRDYRDLVPAWLGTYLSLEPAACLIRAYETTLVPGWLQTEAYAAAAIELASSAPDQSAIRQLVELRMRRQQFLERANGPRLWVIIDEVAIRRQMGSVKIMREQIRHLIYMSKQPGITIQVIPVGTSVHAVAGGPITCCRSFVVNTCASLPVNMGVDK